MMSFGFLIFFSYKLSLAKIGSLVMGYKINHNLLMVWCAFLLILFYASLHNYIHVIFNVPISIYLFSFFYCYELTIFINSDSFFYNNHGKFTYICSKLRRIYWSLTLYRFFIRSFFLGLFWTRIPNFLDFTKIGSTDL